MTSQQLLPVCLEQLHIAVSGCPLSFAWKKRVWPIRVGQLCSEWLQEGQEIILETCTRQPLRCPSPQEVLPLDFQVEEAGRRKYLRQLPAKCGGCCIEWKASARVALGQVIWGRRRPQFGDCCSI